MWHQTDIDGVAVFWADAPAPLSATLIFRVGWRDETFLTRGITHLVEHLTMHTLGRRRHPHNASVNHTFTTFDASGRPEQVVSFLRDVCAALDQLPVARLATEIKVLQAEGGPGGALGEQLTTRFGFRGLGLSGTITPALDQISDETVLAHAATYFNRSNAALVLTGPPPPGLTLPLPNGVVASVPVDRRRQIPLPMWFTSVEPPTSVSFLVSGRDPVRSEVTLATCRIAMERAMDHVRHSQGWAYDVSFELTMTETDTIVSFAADPPEEHAADVQRALVEILRDLRDEGPTDAELAGDLEDLEEHSIDPRSVEGDLVDAGADHLLGQVPQQWEDRMFTRKQVTRDDCRAVLEVLDSSLIVGMPIGTEPADGALEREPEDRLPPITGATFPRSVLRGRRDGVPKNAQLVVGEDGVSLVDSDHIRTIRWSDLVGVDRDGDEAAMTLVSADSTVIPFNARWFKQGNRALKLLEQRVPTGLRFTSPD